MTQQILGIDISKQSFDTAFLDGGQTYQGHFGNDPKGLQKLARWLTKRHADQVHVCMEVTSRYWEEAVYFLYEQGYKSTLHICDKKVKKGRRSSLPSKNRLPTTNYQLPITHPPTSPQTSTPATSAPGPFSA